MKTIFRIAVLLFFIQSNAQVGINTTSPKAQLDILASDSATPTNTDGLLIPRVDAFPAINPTAAQQGMMVYLMVTAGTNTPGFYYWDNLTSSWVGISSKANDKAWYKVGTTASPNAITDDMFHTGKVGIGNSTPASKLHVMNNASGMTPNPSSVATIENNTATYLSMLSGDESGILFGANGVSTNGGIIYNPTGLPNGMLLRTNGNANRLVISDTGNIAIGSFVPNYPLHFPGTLGDKISLYGGVGAHYGFGIQGNLLQIHSDLLGSDIAFGYGSSGSFTEGVRIKGNGNMGIGLTNPDYPLQFKTAIGDKISLYGGTGAHYGFGIQGSLLQMHSSNNLSDIAFGYGSSAAFTESMRIKGNGNVGIGVTNPLSKLHIKTVATGMTPNPNASATIEDDEYTFLNLLSNQESGVVFGTQGISSSGGIIYSPASMPKALQFRTDTNLTRMTISDVGNVAIGFFKANYPLQFDGILGDKISLYGGAGNHYGFGIQASLLQIHTSTNASDVAFGYGSSSSFTENVRFKGNGNVGIKNSNPNFPLHFNDNLGDKISLYGASGSHFGFGVQTNLFQIHASNSTDDIAFGYGTSATFTESFRIKGNGNIGIGITNPQAKLHIRTNTTGMTPNPFAPAIIENSDLTFLNLLSNQESGVVFGSSGVSTSGGIIYSPAGMPNSLQFRTNTNLTRMTISDVGNVGIGNIKADFPMQFDGVLGDKISLFGGAGSHYGFGVQSTLLQIHSATSVDDIAFGYGTSAAFTERMRIKGTGEVGIGTNNPTSELEVNGFTKLGTTAPAVKMIKLTGTSSNSQGGFVQVVHGLTSSKILSVSVLVEYSSGNSVPPSYTGGTGYEYDYYISATSVVVWNKAANSANILSKPIRVLVTYEE
ncbi:hypothetical protein [Flavobacterium sp.]|uniref:hypothetical protein n=1 Tax=Flavobacterium sp. TaxID=239 RepID=UPI00286C6D4E|nr:hypothetical protein [Flavobacterium sp.]